jgi:hypothetical protein
LELVKREVIVKDDQQRLYKVKARCHQGLLGIMDSLGHHRLIHLPTGLALLTQCYPSADRADRALGNCLNYQGWGFKTLPTGREGMALFDGLIKIANAVGACTFHFQRDIEKVYGSFQPNAGGSA